MRMIFMQTLVQVYIPKSWAGGCEMLEIPRDVWDSSPGLRAAVWHFRWVYGRAVLLALVIVPVVIAGGIVVSRYLL